MPLLDEDVSEIRHSPTALGPASGLKCSAWAIALDRPGDCNVARRGYVMQNDEEVKSARPVALVTEALYRPAPPNR